MSTSYLALAIAIMIGVGGQLLLKGGAGASTLVGQITSPETLGGLALYALSAALYMFALRRIPVSVAFPSVSLSYVVVAAAAARFEHEPLGWSKLVGVVLICGGVALVARTA